MDATSLWTTGYRETPPLLTLLTSVQTNECAKPGQYRHGNSTGLGSEKAIGPPASWLSSVSTCIVHDVSGGVVMMFLNCPSVCVSDITLDQRQPLHSPVFGGGSWCGSMFVCVCEGVYVCVCVFVWVIVCWCVCKWVSECMLVCVWVSVCWCVCEWVCECVSVWVCVSHLCALWSNSCRSRRTHTSPVGTSCRSSRLIAGPLFSNSFFMVATGTSVRPRKSVRTHTLRRGIYTITVMNIPVWSTSWQRELWHVFQPSVSLNHSSNEKQGRWLGTSCSLLQWSYKMTSAMRKLFKSAEWLKCISTNRYLFTHLPSGVNCSLSKMVIHKTSWYTSLMWNWQLKLHLGLTVSLRVLEV